MGKPFFIAAGLFVLALAFSCKPKKQEQPAGQPVTLENRTVQQNKGTDCDKQPDSLRTNCAIIDFSAPKIQGAGAQSALGKSLDAWADKFLIHLLIWTDYPESDPSKALTTVDAAIKRYHAIHDEAAGSVSSGLFNVACTNSVLLNDGKFLTVELDGHSFEGGNRALDEVAIASFDCKTGKQLAWDDLVKDKAVLLPAAQAMVRKTRAEAFTEGFEFDKEEQFTLPSSYGLTDKGLLFYYQPDEIFHLGGATEFVLPFSELGGNLKVEAPAPQAGEMDTAAEDIYAPAGDSLVIPTFEIEVRTSKKAGQTLQRKKETIIVAAYFTGDPNNIKDRDEAGMMPILNKEIELKGGSRIARFENLKFSKQQFGKLADKDISLLINVYSGRKSSSDNLLSCSLLDIKASKFKDKRFSLGCSLIEESTDGSTSPVASFSLSEADGKAALPLVVDCSERGEMSFAGEPVKDEDELKTKLHAVLTDLLKTGYKELPGIETNGCMMGMQGAIRDVYEELKNEMQHPNKNPSTAPVEKTTETGSPKAKNKTAASAKPATKKVPATPAAPAVTVSQKGEITLNGKKVTVENLRKELQQALLAYAVIPDEIPVKSIGQVGMGMRGEVNTVVNESIAGAKWIRKKTALAELSTAVGKKLGTSVQLELNDYQTSGNFAFIDARPRTTDGKAIDYSKTTYKQDYEAGKFAGRVLGLLQYENGAWKILIYSLDTNNVPVDAWVKNYKAPKVLFGKGK